MKVSHTNTPGKNDNIYGERNVLFHSSLDLSNQGETNEIQFGGGGGIPSKGDFPIYPL